MNKLYISFCIVSLFLTSCKKEIIQDPQTSKVATKFYSTEIEVEEGVNAAYGALQSVYKLNLPALGEISSDNTFDEVPANDGGKYGQLDEFTTISQNEIVSDTWKGSYVGIQRANIILNRINAIKFTDEAVKNARIGEMKFIRALLYFNLVRLYGDVPLVISETENPNDFFGRGRSAKDDVYAQIELDLTEAISLLPTTVSEQGRVTQGAAQALLGKVYLTAHNYSEARMMLEAVYNSGQFTLQSDLASIFAEENENNSEIIFAVQFASGLNGNSMGSNLFQQFSPSGTHSGSKGHNLPTKELYAKYTADDLRGVAYVGATDEGVPFTKKYVESSTQIDDGGSDFVVLRFADVVLMLAEIEAEQGNVSGAANYLNEIRTRAGLSPTVAASQDQMTDAIALERRLELLGEGHRWFDLIRTGKAVEVMNAWFAVERKSISIDDHHLLLPIPQSQINTDPAISQNAGY